MRFAARAGEGRVHHEESVQDIEAVREALGYEKLVLYGTSYGTKVALEYAERYPEHVEALVLDSVVLPEGPEPFSLSSIQALKPMLEELCSEGACAHITSNPIADIATPGGAAAQAPARRLGVRRAGAPPCRHDRGGRPLQRAARPATSTPPCARCCRPRCSRRCAATPTRCCA